ncbi:SGNH/GDSL hydrolase family protein [Sphingomonas tabacisoli]|uniref:SGNH/GDSL hydrolase family protein n=1 Tax=Sphingomonas tabacisoli TaxID=2249466 RepID=A0ABW4I1A0_9SPHN
MKLHRLMRGVFAAALVTSALPAVAATPNSFDALYVFGDSLVDAGNIATLTGNKTPNPALGYRNGRFTNGYDYVDYINFELFGTPTRASLQGGNNYSFGGARVVTDATDTIPDLTLQISTYAAAKGGAADPNALYILNAGGNDIFALERFQAGNANALLPFTNSADYVNAIVSTYSGQVQRLNDLGARNILITGIPNATDPQAFTIDAQLQSALDGLSLNANTNLYRFSYLKFFQQLQANPGSLGLPPLRTDLSCIQLQAQASDCAGIFSFDGTHPTAAVQSALFRSIAGQFGVSAVPEPRVWAMMLAGFLLMGAAIRRQQGRLAPA